MVKINNNKLRSDVKVSAAGREVWVTIIMEVDTDYIEAGEDGEDEIRVVYPHIYEDYNGKNDGLLAQWLIDTGYFYANGYDAFADDEIGGVEIGDNPIPWDRWFTPEVLKDARPSLW